MSLHHTYFGHQPLNGHHPDCVAAGPTGNGGWEAAIAIDEIPFVDPKTGDRGYRRECGLRLLCRSCGAVIQLHADDADALHYTNVTELGYGSKPERCAGMWLHPGAPLLPGEGPYDYYVTDSPHPPADESQVAGVISRFVTKRGAKQWLAAYGQRQGGGAISRTDEHFKTKAAAVKWITATRAAAESTPDSGTASGDPAPEAADQAHINP
ncbi:hypothetical protein [Actinomadura sp. DC4]|uniref:hypothetical protein n=1 Tax=Actinomadura sp. DC4 TaxID=3055069 RepID=UPI0025B24EA4|nr:hypothetical protein [Actinomadura sp. DC4]MDN3356033.1 hypothetical protein [Actinomadura sp. DC4]